ARGRRQVGYHHLLLRRHAIVFANGAAVESLYPGPMALRSLGAQACAGLVQAMPMLAGVMAGKLAAEGIYGPTARPILPRREVTLQGVIGGKTVAGFDLVG
ncbi:MAG: Hint domain-containing protein, partial [Paracoccaceae bacterium]